MKFLYRNIYQHGRLFWRGMKYDYLNEAKARATRSNGEWLGVETVVDSPDPRFKTTVVFFQFASGHDPAW